MLMCGNRGLCDQAAVHPHRIFFYLQLLWATLLGLMLFGELPDRWTFAGGTIVIASGLYLLHQERAERPSPSVQAGD
jgi:hypothetical protein